jgi:hypothetical protein
MILGIMSIRMCSSFGCGSALLRYPANNVHAAPYKPPIDFEKRATWPDWLKVPLDKIRNTCAWEQQADEILAQERLLGFHCTRLLPYEAAEVLETGLCPHSPRFIAKRINRAREAGYLAADICARLLAKNEAREVGRVGKICFFNMRSLLRKESEVHRFFESWGGEVLYNSHEKDRITGPTLMCLGEPYIVTASLPANKLEGSGYNLARYFANKLLNGASRGQGCQMELYHSYVQCPVPSEWVIKLVSFGDPAFESLTHCHAKRWNLCKTRGRGHAKRS